VKSQPVHISETGDENVAVEQDTESSDSVMHQKETDKNHLESKSEVPPQRYPLRKRKPKESPDHRVYQTV
jgi:hypothetical protein